MVCAVIVSGSGYTVSSFASLESFNGESVWSVVDDETESSASERPSGSGELLRNGEGTLAA
jgi:hypothetical protein